MHHRSWCRGRAWKLTDPWTPRTRPPILAKPQNGFAQAPTRIINISLQKNRRPEPSDSVGQLPTDSAEEAVSEFGTARLGEREQRDGAAVDEQQIPQIERDGACFLIEERPEDVDVVCC